MPPYGSLLPALIVAAPAGAEGVALVARHEDPQQIGLHPLAFGIGLRPRERHQAEDVRGVPSDHRRVGVADDLAARIVDEGEPVAVGGLGGVLVAKPVANPKDPSNYFRIPRPGILWNGNHHDTLPWDGGKKRRVNVENKRDELE